MHTAPSIIYVSSGNSHALSLYQLGLRRFQSFETIYDRADAPSNEERVKQKYC